MTPHDLIFWYTGAAIWSIMAVCVAVSMAVAAVISVTWSWRKAHTIGWSWMVSAKIRDMDLEDADIIHAMDKEWGKPTEHVFDVLRRVQAQLKNSTVVNQGVKSQLYPPTSREVERVAGQLQEDQYSVNLALEWFLKDRIHTVLRSKGNLE